MWHNTYKNYPHDTKLKKSQVSPSKGIIGCEMHEIYGWGESYHQLPKNPNVGTLSAIWIALTKPKTQTDKG